jgi:hypothetical protein
MENVLYIRKVVEKNDVEQEKNDGSHRREKKKKIETFEKKIHGTVVEKWNHS